MFNRNVRDRRFRMKMLITRYAIVAMDGCIAAMEWLFHTVLLVSLSVLCLLLGLTLGPLILVITGTKKLAWYMRSIQRRDSKEPLLTYTLQQSECASRSYRAALIADGEDYSAYRRRMIFEEGHMGLELPEGEQHDTDAIAKSSS